MRRRTVTILTLTLFVFASDSACNRSRTPTSPSAPDTPAVPVTQPAPPFSLDAPAAPSKEYNGQDLSTFSGAALRAGASELAEAEEFAAAIQVEHWAVAAEPTDGIYNLACYYARAGLIDAGFYWLQKAALDEGVDADYLLEDRDMIPLRSDPRWGRIEAFMRACNDYWPKSGHHREVVVTPRGYRPGAPIPVLVGLHGYGAMPEDFGGESEYQELADELNIAVVGISGTLARGPSQFVWSEDIDRDMKHVLAGLAHVKDRVTPQPGAVVVIGFSQGGQLAGEFFARAPASYAGAIMLCPGMLGDAHLQEVTKSPLLADRSVIIVSGKKESLGNRLMAMDAAKWFQTARARVTVKVFPEMGHSFPPDYFQHLRTWLGQILRRPKDLEGHSPSQAEMES